MFMPANHLSSGLLLRCLRVVAMLTTVLVFCGQSAAQCLFNGPSQYHSARSMVDEDTVFTIQVVFHNLYRDESQQITSAQVDQQIHQLNLDFNRLNADSIMTPEDFVSVAASCNISFCLAVTAPDGTVTSGLTARSTDVPQIGFTGKYYQSREGGQDIWAPSHYLNVWVCEILEDGGVAGFAESPYEIDQEKDGVVIDYRYFTNLDSTNSILGRTLTHEVGHWLGLAHLWGSEDGCDTDDGLHDTPQQETRYRGCPVFPQMSCESTDMYMNFMDLVDDHCMNLFTRDQRELMRSNIMTYRSGLPGNQPCDQTVPIREHELVREIVVYPNPASHTLNVQMQGHNPGLELFDHTGRFIQAVDPNGSTQIGHLPIGVYFLRSSKGAVKKLIIAY